MRGKGCRCSLTLGFTLTLLVPIFCQSSCRKEAIRVHNKRPKFANYVRLEKLHGIDVTQISMFGKNEVFGNYIDFDEDDSLYILDSYESRCYVFDKTGKPLRTFGRKGQGPEEFENPNAIVIKKDRIFVFQAFHGSYKVTDLSGHYISSGLMSVENPLRYKSVGSGFSIFRGKTDRTFTSLELILSAYDEKFTKSKDIFSYRYPPGLRGPSYFRYMDWLVVAPDGRFFFPEDNLNMYSIIRYDPRGRAELIFGRDYEPKGYSSEARARFEALDGKAIKAGEASLAKTPPVMGAMFLDDNENIWAITGETSEDNGNPAWENTIDIFSSRGEWLSSLKSRILSRYCIYHHGRIYKIPPPDLNGETQAIEVFKVVYAPVAQSR